MSSHAWNSKWTKTQLRDALDRQFDEWYSLLAQREGEIEALRGEMKAERARHLKAEADYDSFLMRLSEDVSRAFGINAREEWQEALAALRAALSDNQEGQDE